MPQPTQIAFPGRTTVRTLLQVLIGLAAAAPVLISTVGLDTTGTVVGVVLAVSAVITRVMAIPGVDEILAKLGLAAEPPN